MPSNSQVKVRTKRSKKYNRTQQNLLRVIKRVIDKHMRRNVAAGRKISKRWIEQDWDEDGAYALDHLLPFIVSKPKSPQSWTMFDESMIAIFTAYRRIAYGEEGYNARVERAILADLWKNAAEYELESALPPARRERAVSKPRTFVEKRADTVAEKVKEWERKLRLAKTKLATYQRKQKYYSKKGEVN